MPKKDYKLQSRASKEQLLARRKLLELWRRCPIPEEELLVNLGLYIRSSVLAKFLYINNCLEAIKSILFVEVS